MLLFSKSSLIVWIGNNKPLIVSPSSPRPPFRHPRAPRSVIPARPVPSSPRRREPRDAGRRFKIPAFAEMTERGARG